MNLHAFLTNDFIYNLASGLLVKISFGIFFVVIVIRTVWFMSLTRIVKNDRSVQESDIKRRFSAPSFVKKFPIHINRYIKSMQHTIVMKSPVTIIVSLVFHLTLIVTPLCLLAHNIMISRWLGISFFSFPEKATNIMTVIFLLCVVYFLFRRIFVARVRIITSVYDYIILTITALPFLTGFLAYYQVYDYKMMIVLHMLTGELMLIVAPFTKVFHMVFFFVGRFMIIGQHTIGKGRRVWHW